jgi:[CysO sulfur-carrier protein]-S-L-cysteine hydrolase
VSSNPITLIGFEKVIELPKGMVDEIVEHARQEAPNEACGVIAGPVGRPVHLYRMRNAESSPTNYRFDEREQIRVFDEIEDKGWDLLGFYHSHTRSEAYPSRTDRARALWRDPVTDEEVPLFPGASYVIASIRDPEPEVRAFRFDGGEIGEEEVRLT